MISLPPGFDASALVQDFVDLSLPIIGVALLIYAFVIVNKALKEGAK